ncbi:MAG TPA: hypothetical protein DD390_00315 [Rhodospirillaceae bacterium]|nr:hypothetical protein [Rhodospirillaceae bacterium]MAX61920.1 hypothetical protein [Rhodospirillaceae bacterium]MAX63256.1 hypothetical protein [Rhodospirillaceae bacterium]HBM11116.1 hypothetical protein [Rhodospirillaceae bacterium]|tara:strand:- start:67841 stop:68221 length:381 start_codon:yes stop_codon:yes gene_type:complete
MLKEYFVGGVVLCFCIVILHAVFWPSDRSFLVNAESNMVDVEQLPFYGIGMGSLIKLCKDPAGTDCSYQHVNLAPSPPESLGQQSGVLCFRRIEAGAMRSTGTCYFLKGSLVLTPAEGVQFYRQVQ